MTAARDNESYWTYRDPFHSFFIGCTDQRVSGKTGNVKLKDILLLKYTFIFSNCFLETGLCCKATSCSEII